MAKGYGSVNVLDNGVFAPGELAMRIPDLSSARHVGVSDRALSRIHTGVSAGDRTRSLGHGLIFSVARCRISAKLNPLRAAAIAPAMANGAVNTTKESNAKALASACDTWK